MTHRRILLIAVAVPLVLSAWLLIASGPLRRLAWASLHSPDRLQALIADPRIRFEPGAEDLARILAAALPRATETIERAQGRPFKSIALYAFASRESFAAYGAGTAGPRGTTWVAACLSAPDSAAAVRAGEAHDP